MLTYEVRIWKVREVRSAAENGKSAYQLRWKVQGKVWPRTFPTAPLADAFRARLLTAQKEGKPFDTETGLPFDPAEDQKRKAAEARKQAVSSYAFMREYMGWKWRGLSGNSRETTARVLATLAMTLVSDRPGRPDDEVLWKALYTYAFVPPVWPDDQRPKRIKARPKLPAVPADQQAALIWVSKASLPMKDIEHGRVARQALDALKVNRDGASAADATFKRRRGVLTNLIAYAIEAEELDFNPLMKLKEKPISKPAPLNQDTVCNPDQFQEVLTAVTYVGSYRRARGRRLKVMFALNYYGGLRPEEALGLRNYQCTLPEKGFGELRLKRTKPTAGKRWTDSGESHDDRGLKGRKDDEERIVPIPPILVRIIKEHIAEFGVAKDGRIVFNERGGVPVSTTYTRVWREARELAFTPEQIRDGLGATPYSARHAYMSILINGGMDVSDAAEIGGNSVEVALRHYTKRVAGREGKNKQRIARLLEGADETTE